MTHTPGPWKWIDRDPTGKTFYEGPMAVLVGGGDKEVCDFGDNTQYYPRQGTEPEEADRRLIAAAPDLLAACEAMLEANYMPGSTMTLALNAMAAIAKAGGK